ncbi:MAG TPA: D-arabinono-1,4-lactone oxidase [Nocardioides sp.]
MSDPSPTSWANWAGNQRADRIDVVRPGGPGGSAEIAEVVTSAARAGRRVRPIGSGHSFTAIGRPEDIQLRLDRHAGLVAFDAAAGLITVQAGMTLHRLNALLEAAGFAATNLGDVDAQTLAGAVSTGTHGTGARYGGIATQIRGLELVLADGSVVTCSADENPDLFRSARVSLGALGIVSTVTVQVEPAFALHAVEGGGELSDTLRDFDELADGTDHFEFYWFPHTTRVLTKRNTRRPLAEGISPLSRRRAWWDDEFLSNSVFGAAVSAGQRFPRLVRPLAKLSGHALGDRAFSDVSHRVFVSPRRVRFVEMEYAVPRETVVPLVRELAAAVEGSDWRIAVPIEVRVAAADDITLSTASGRDTAYVAVHVPPGCPDQEAYFGTLERLAGEVAGRPHWGKLHGLDAATLRERYPHFDEFVDLRDRLDPTGVFSNAHLDRILGPAGDRDDASARGAR